MPAERPPALALFDRLVSGWFAERLGAPSVAQEAGWPHIAQGHNTLIAAPTGSGKTLAAFLHALDSLLRQARAGALPDGVQVVYVSPLKALSNDVQKNLLGPLEELAARAEQGGEPFPELRVQVRTGDTPAAERQRMAKRPPHILVTTPESLYLYLTADKSRQTLRQVRTVIVDEIHALARDKRGAHLALSLERLAALTGRPLQRIGLSATQKPIAELAAFLVGSGERCETAEIGHLRPWELSVEVPDQELTAVASHEVWGQVYDRLVALTAGHRTVLVFANTRRLSERVAHDLGERLGEGQVAAHHGSMARDLRLVAEEKLKRGELRVMVATASLELGIDIGSVDLVCQLGSPRSIAAFLQRVGRAGHHYGGTSKGVLFATTRDELVECTALVRAVREGTLDAVRMPHEPLDVLAQQVVAACVSEDWDEGALLERVRRAHPYRTLTPERFEQVLSMLSEPVGEGRGRARLHLHRDQVNHKVRARRGARLFALSNGGTIADTFNYPVIAEPEGKAVGTVDEDFAVESVAGDVFLLGSTGWRIQRVMAGTLRVEDARGQPPSVPFWQGEAPSRTDELCAEVGRLREEVAQGRVGEAELSRQVGLTQAAAQALVGYVRAGAQALGAVPTVRQVVAERFFDEAGGMQLLIHAPFGGRINRAWGLALRKRFCRTFDFELQAAATDDGILLSLGEQHSFPLADIFAFLSAANVREVLTQAVLQSPLFATRFRWVAARALLLSRYHNGARVPPILQRARAEDLLAAVFPAQLACQDNRGGGDLEVPDHPLVHEALEECLRQAMDVDGLVEVLEQLRRGEIRTHAVELPEPSPFAHALLNSQPYTYLDEAPLEERRARAVSARRSLSPEDASSFGALDATAIAQVVSEAAPPVRDAEELHDALLQLGLYPARAEQHGWLWELAAQGRAATLRSPGELCFWVAAERVRQARALFPGAPLDPPLEPLPVERECSRAEAVGAVVRGHFEVEGPARPDELAQALGLEQPEVEAALYELEATGQLLRGHFWPRPPEAPARLEFCDRRLLQRIHRLTLGRLRKEIEPLSARDYMRFLFKWHHLEDGDGLRGRGGVLKAISLLQGYEAPAVAWEAWLLPARVRPYLPELLERLCWDGEVVWGRLSPCGEERVQGPRRGSPATPARRTGPSRAANLTFVRRDALEGLLHAVRPGARLADGGVRLPEGLSATASEVASVLERRGACFFADLVQATRRLPAEVEDALWELVAQGALTADAVDNLRVLQSPQRRKRQRLLRRGGPGRWTLLAPVGELPPEGNEEAMARLFLARYGIVFRDVLAREAAAPPWRELVRTYRRLEVRGELRGGRFVAGLVGEQFALPGAVELARAVRRTEPSGHRVRLCAVDPLNLTGIVTPGPRVPAVLGQFVEWVDGVPQLPEASSAAVPVTSASRS
jgi:ATP-dependent helicase Lhr and Lhr-like helicase